MGQVKRICAQVCLNSTPTTRVFAICANANTVTQTSSRWSSFVRRNLQFSAAADAENVRRVSCNVLSCFWVSVRDSLFNIVSQSIEHIRLNQCQHRIIAEAVFRRSSFAPFRIGVTIISARSPFDGLLSRRIHFTGTIFSQS